MKARSKPVERKPIVMLIASVVCLIGAVAVVVAITNFAALGWWALPVIAGGLSSVGLAGATIVTGKPEWLMIDLILPG